MLSLYFSVIHWRHIIRFHISGGAELVLFPPSFLDWYSLQYTVSGSSVATGYGESGRKSKLYIEKDKICFWSTLSFMLFTILSCKLNDERIEDKMKLSSEFWLFLSLYNAPCRTLSKLHFIFNLQSFTQFTKFLNFQCSILPFLLDL